MSHKAHYDNLIKKARNRTTTGYVEKHHVIPKSLGGSDDPDNIVALYPREHLVAHKLLAHIHGGKMWQALWFMSNNGRYTSRGYSWVKKNFIQAQKDSMTEEMRERISSRLRGRKGVPRSQETREKIRQFQTKNMKSVSQIDTEGNVLKQYPSLTEAQRATGVSQKKIGQVASGKRTSAGGYRWAFEPRP